MTKVTPPSKARKRVRPDNNLHPVIPRRRLSSDLGSAMCYAVCIALCRAIVDHVVSGATDALRTVVAASGGVLGSLVAFRILKLDAG